MNINDNFIIEDGLGHLFDANGKQLMTLQVNNVGAPLESCLSFNDFKLLNEHHALEDQKVEAVTCNREPRMEIDSIRFKQKRYAKDTLGN